jgi:hypothetical protein
MFEITQNSKVVGITLIDDDKEPCEPGGGCTPEVQTAAVEIGLDAEMRVGHDEGPLAAFNQNGWTIRVEFRGHGIYTT